MVFTHCWLLYGTIILPVTLCKHIFPLCKQTIKQNILTDRSLTNMVSFESEVDQTSQIVNSDLEPYHPYWIR